MSIFENNVTIFENNVIVPACTQMSCGYDLTTDNTFYIDFLQKSQIFWAEHSPSVQNTHLTNAKQKNKGVLLEIRVSLNKLPD